MSTQKLNSSGLGEFFDTNTINVDRSEEEKQNLPRIQETKDRRSGKKCGDEKKEENLSPIYYFI